MYEPGLGPAVFQHSPEMLRKMHVRGDRSGTAVSDMKIRQWEGKRKRLSAFSEICAMVQGGVRLEWQGFYSERVTKSIMGK